MQLTARMGLQKKYDGHEMLDYLRYECGDECDAEVSTNNSYHGMSTLRGVTSVVAEQMNTRRRFCGRESVFFFFSTCLSRATHVR